MGQAAQRLTMTTAEFLAWDAKQIERHEFVNGEVFAMAEAEDRHVTTSLNIAMSLRRHLRGTPGRTFMSDMKLHVASADSYFYPDVMVTCDAADLASPLVKTAPVLVVEVLSPTTAAYDRGEKFARYRRLPSLQEYMLVDIDTRRTDLYRKGADSMWVLHPSDDGQAVHLASVVLDLSAEALFAEVDPPAAA